MNALIAVTTCPRPGGVSYLAETLASIGRDEVVVFDDTERRGNRWNTWRVLKAGGAYDRLLLFQDDVLVEPGTVDRMLAIEIPDDVGLVTFHSLNGDDFDWCEPSPGIHRFPAHQLGGWGLMGLQAVVIPGDHARWLAEQDLSKCPKPGPHHDDYAIGWFTARSPRPFKLVVSPSRVRHIGERSACHDEERRQAGVGIPHAGRTLADLR